MFRLSLISAGSLVLCTGAVAQNLASTPAASHGPAKFGGTFHVATGTWTRSVPSAAARGTTDVIYNNTASQGFYASQTDDVESYQIVDAGRIPSTGSAGTANRDNYNVTGVTLGYCITDNTSNSADVLVTIYGSYAPCEDPAQQACSGEFLSTGLPGATAANIAAGYASCWVVTFDLTGGEEICLLGDGDGVFDSDLALDSFGIGYEFDPGGLGGYVNSGISFGAMLAGDRMWTVQASGEISASGGAGVPGCPTAAAGGGGDTYYGPAECCLPALGGYNSSGLDTDGAVWMGFHPSSINSSGCYWFGGGPNTVGCAANSTNPAPYLALYTLLEADQTTDCIPTGCPCDPLLIADFCNPAPNNSTGSPAVLTCACGSGFETGLHLDVSGGPLPLSGGTRMLGYFLVGNEATPGITISDGLFCLVGTPTAFFGRYNVAGTTRYSLGLFDADGNLENTVGTGGISGYGFDVPFDIGIAGSPATTIMSGDTYHFQCWYLDRLAGIGHSNFSNAVSVTFP